VRREIEEDRHMRESGNRSTGATAELSARLKRDQAGDEIVQDRVRSALGQLASQPDAIKVSVYVRRVILNGPVPAAELDSILRSVARVRGVREVENQLEVYEQTSGVSSLWDQEQSDRTDWPLSATESTV
jgi:osmotically-inducible protein OsmY